MCFRILYNISKNLCRRIKSFQISIFVSVQDLCLGSPASHRAYAGCASVKRSSKKEYMFIFSLFQKWLVIFMKKMHCVCFCCFVYILAHAPMVNK